MYGEEYYRRLNSGQAKYYTEKFSKIRKELEPHFSQETCFGEFNSELPSKGHCAVVAAIVNNLFFGSFVSTKVNGESHWYSLVRLQERAWEIDLTGDQFGESPVRVQRTPIYGDRKLRADDELNEETKERAIILAKKANYTISFENQHENMA
jgi:hypothetical protein